MDTVPCVTLAKQVYFSVEHKQGRSQVQNAGPLIVMAPGLTTEKETVMKWISVDVRGRVVSLSDQFDDVVDDGSGVSGGKVAAFDNARRASLRER